MGGAILTVRPRTQVFVHADRVGNVGAGAQLFVPCFTDQGGTGETSNDMILADYDFHILAFFGAVFTTDLDVDGTIAFRDDQANAVIRTITVAGHFYQVLDPPVLVAANSLCNFHITPLEICK